MAWIVPIPPSRRHPYERYRVGYQDGKRQRSAGIFPTKRRALAEKRAIERGDRDQPLDRVIPAFPRHPGALPGRFQDGKHQRSADIFLTKLLAVNDGGKLTPWRPARRWDQYSRAVDTGACREVIDLETANTGLGDGPAPCALPHEACPDTSTRMFGRAFRRAEARTSTPDALAKRMSDVRGRRMRAAQPARVSADGARSATQP